MKLSLTNFLLMVVTIFATTMAIDFLTGQSFQFSLQKLIWKLISSIAIGAAIYAMTYINNKNQK